MLLFLKNLLRPIKSIFSFSNYKTNIKGPTFHRALSAVKWSTLKSILDNKLVASTYIWILVLPIAMSATSKFPKTIATFPWGIREPLVIRLDIPINWYLLYFSAILFALARIIYVIRCPEFLRHHSSATEATAKGITAEIVWDKVCEHVSLYKRNKLRQSSPEKAAMINILRVLEDRDSVINADIQKNQSLLSISRKYYIIDKPGTGFFQLISKRDYNNGTQFTPKSADRSSNLLIWRFIELQDIYSPKIRVITTLISIIGAVFFILPILEGFWSVWNSLLPTIFY